MAKKSVAPKPKRQKTRANAHKGTRTTTARPRAATASRQPGAGTVGGLPFRTVTGQLVVNDAAKAIDWYKHVFGAKELERQPGPGGRIMHAVLKIGDTPVMISDNFGPPLPVELNGAYLHVQDKEIQAMWDHALEEGATAVLPLDNQFWGQKYGQLRDPFGQLWSLGWPVKMTEAEKAKKQQEAMAVMAAPTQ